MDYNRAFAIIEATFLKLNTFAKTQKWQERLQQTQRDYLTVAAELLGLDTVEMTSKLSDNNMAGNIYGFIFDDFCTKNFLIGKDEEDNFKFENLISHYLSAKGWKEIKFAKDYLQIAQSSQFGFWRITNITPGKGIALTTFKNDTATYEINDSRLSNHLKVGDLILTKIITVNGSSYTNGICAQVKEELITSIYKELHEGQEEFLKNYISEAKNSNTEVLQDDDYVRSIYLINNLGITIFKHWVADFYKHFLSN